MGKRAMKIYLQLTMLCLSILLMVFTFMGLYGGDESPVNGTLSASLSFVLPGLIIANVIFLIYWICRLRIYVLIPLISLICSYRYIGTIYQFGSEPENLPSHVTIATYNVRMFKGESLGLIAESVKDVLMREGADVVCLQEFNNNVNNQEKTVTTMMSDAYPYHAMGQNDMAIFSKFPIKKTKSFPFEYSNNSFMWADVAISDQKIVRVFNVHMETTGINSTLHQAQKAMAAATDTTGVVPQGNVNNSSVYQALLGNYVFSLNVRSGQSILVANEKRESPYPIILCGDFNDVPYSFTYHTLKGDLTDGFTQGGHGFMYTYRGASGLFRIDYIFQDPSIRCIDYYSPKENLSDHNPVFSKVTF